MATVGNLKIKISADDGGLKGKLQKVEKTLQKASRRMSAVGRDLSMTLTTSIGGLGFAAIDAAMDFEVLETQLSVLTGSAEEGAKAFKRIADFSAKTPFQLEDLVKANNTMMGFGLASDEAFQSLQMIGDAVAATGGDMQRITTAYAQSIAANKVNAQDINQFINNGIPIISMLADVMGVSVGEVKELASQGKVTGEVLKAAFTKATSEGGKFAGATEKLAGTLRGVFSTVKDNIRLALGELGKDMTESFDIKAIADEFVKSLQRVVAIFKSLTPQQKKFVIGMAAVLAAIGPVLVALGSLAGLLSLISGAMATIMGTITLVTAALAGLGFVFYKIYKNSNSAIDSISDFDKELQRATSNGAAPLLSKLDGLEKKLIGLKKEGKDFNQVQKELRTTYADHIEDADKLGETYEDLKTAIDEARGSVLDLAKQQAALELTKEVDAKLSALKSREIELEFKFGESPEFIVRTAKMLGALGNNAQEINRILKDKGINISFKEQQDLISEIYKAREKENNLIDKKNKLLKIAGGLVKEIEGQGAGSGGSGGVSEGGESVFSKINKDYKKQSKELDNLRAAGLISEKDYNKQFEELQRNFLESLAKSGLAGTELYKQIADQYVRVRKETIQQIESIDSQFGGVGADMKKFLKGTADTAMKGGKQEGLISDYMLSKLTEYEQKAQSAIQTLGGLFDSINSRQASVIENQYRSQIHAVNQLGLSEEQRIKRISKLEEEKEKKLAKLQERRAKREKAFAILSATIGTALAVISQMRVPGVGIAQAIAANAMGIAQIATIAAAPIPKFADGGIVSGRTLAEVGEYAGASSNPEVIAPLDKLRSMISDLGGGQTFGEFRLRGEDLILAVDRANNNASRFSGRKQF